MAIMLITHDLGVIAEMATDVAVMYLGRVVEQAPVDAIFHAPRHPYTRALLSAFPNIHADRRTLAVIPGAPPDLRNPPPGCRFAPRCSFAMEVCREVVPPEVRFGDGVRVACHLFPTPDTVTLVEASGPSATLIVGRVADGAHEAAPGRPDVPIESSVAAALAARAADAGDEADDADVPSTDADADGDAGAAATTDEATS